MKYKNKSNQDLSFAGVGIVESGAEFESEIIIENPNLVLIEEKLQSTKNKLEEKE